MLTKIEGESHSHYSHHLSASKTMISPHCTFSERDRIYADTVCAKIKFLRCHSRVKARVKLQFYHGLSTLLPLSCYGVSTAHIADNLLHSSTTECH